MPDIAQLGLSIDTRQVVEGSKALDSLGEAAVRVEQKTAGATAAVDKLGEANATAKAKVTEGAAAVDAVGEAGVRAAQKVAGTTTSVDSLSAAAVRVRSTSVEGANALDGFTNASAGVWRRGGDAAKSVEALGDAAQRTGQRTAVGNGQMEDTARIMRAQAEQARATAQANVALGNTTTQMTLGQQLFVDKLRDQVAVLGMSRSQLLAYQAAELGVSQETEKLIAKLKQFEDQTRAATEASRAAAAAKRDQERAAFTLSDAIGFLVKAYAALKVAEYVKEMALMAARYETLGVVVQVVGRNAGYTKTQMDTATDSIARQGITMIESRESATKLVQAHVDLKNATVLARIAQDAAVIGHLNSSDAFDRLVNGISRGNVLILRNIGINVNLQTAYRQMADELGKTTKELSENERVQARLNAVIERGSDIAGTYEAAMGTAGKQITSMQRYMTDLKTVSGETFLEVLTVTVMALTKGFKDANGEVNELSRNNQLHEWGSTLAQVFVVVADNVNNAFSAMKLMGAAGTYVSKAADIHTQYTTDRSAAGFSITGQIDAYKKMQAAMEANAKLLGDSKDQILAGEDKFQKAYDERVVTINAKRKKDADEKLKADSDYAQRAQALLVENAGKSLKIQQDAQLALANSVYVGTPTYRDTEGREPKPKADQVENTQLADQIKQYAKEASTAKAHYDALGKLDDMYLKGGELSVQQAYENKRTYALKTYEAEVDAYDLQISALQGHNNTTKAEAAKHQKELNEILGKRDAAEKAFFDASFTRDEEARLRQAAVATAAADAANKEIAAINAQVAAVEEQIRTYGLLPAQKTALAVADLEEQKAALASFEGNEKVIDGINRKIEAMKRLGIVQGKASTQEQGGDVAKAKELLDILTAVDTATKSAAQGMVASFGAVGTAIGGLTTALSGYAVQQQAIAAQLAAATKDAYGDPTKVAKAQAAAAQQGAQAQIKSYGDMASAAKGFFKENTAGYKVMETTEKAFRAYEMAMAVESMIKKIFFKEAEVAANLTLNATKLTGEATTTAASTGLAATEASAWGITAVVKALASLPFPMNLAAGAATLAAVVAIGAKMMGGGGGGGGGQTAATAQKAQGTGSVFGDSGAKSDSVRRSIEQLQANSDLLIPINQGMLTSLQSIQASMSGLTNLVVRTAGLTEGANMGIQTGTISKSTGASIASGAAVGAAAGSYFGPIGTGIGAIGGAIIGGLKSIWGKTTQNIVDSGLQYGGSVRGLQGGKGFDQYASVDTTKSSWFGLSKSTSNSIQTQRLNDELSQQFGLIFTGLDKSLQAASVAMGGSVADVAKVLDSLKLESSKVSLKGLTGTALTDALNSVISKSMDEISQAVFPQFDKFRNVGEGYAETVMRIAGDYAKLDSILASTGTTFGLTGGASIEARERLIELIGGIDKLASQSTSFATNFLTEAERLAPVQKYVAEQLGLMGLAGLDTRDKFKAAVLGLANSGALATKGGAEQYAALLALSDAFAKTHASTEDLTKSEQAIADERKDLQSQLDKLTLSTLQLRAQERAALDASNRALFDQIVARQDLATAYDTESKAITSTIDKLTTFAGSIKTFRDGLVLGSLSTLSPTEKAAEAQRRYSTMLAAARGGDAAAQIGLTGAASAYLTASQAASGTAAQYARDYARVQADMAIMAANVGSQLTTAQAQQVALDKQVAGLITLNDSVKAGAATVAQAIAALGVLGVKQIAGSHAGGLTSVPYDGYTAELHAGERVLTAFEARNYSGQSGGSNEALLAEVKGLREDNRALQAKVETLTQQSQAADIAIAQNTGTVARIVKRWEDNGLLVRATTPIPTKEVETA